MKKFLKVEPFQESLNKGMCGPASLKIVLKYYGVDATEKELAKLAGWRKGVGADDKGIKKAAETFGFKVRIKNSSNYQDIKKWLNKDVPIIVDWFTRGKSDYPDSAISDGHYSVVGGLDDRYIYLQDPEIGKIRKMKREDFMSVWFDFSGKYINKNELIIRQIIAIYKGS